MRTWYSHFPIRECMRMCDLRSCETSRQTVISYGVEGISICPLRLYILNGFEGIHFFYESNQQDATIEVNLLFLVSSTCFDRCLRPSSGALDCIYSIWQYSPKQLPAGVMDELKLNYVGCEACIHASQPTQFSFNSSMTPAGSYLGEYYQIL